MGGDKMNWQDELKKEIEDKTLLDFDELDWEVLISFIESQLKKQRTECGYGKLAELRNLLSPLINYFIMDEEVVEIGYKLDKESRRKVAELTKNMILEKKSIRKHKTIDKIKNLLGDSE